MSKIFLIGFMGVGKTTVGRVLADSINYGFITWRWVAGVRQLNDGVQVKGLFHLGDEGIIPSAGHRAFHRGNQP